MTTWLEEAYGIDESYEAVCQILATDGDGTVFLEIAESDVSGRIARALHNDWRE
jgi:hypothetical protein